MYPTLFQRPSEKAADARPTMPRRHGHRHGHHGHGHGHHAHGHHAHHHAHHHNIHHPHHHNIHHHAHVGTPMGTHTIGGQGVGRPMGSAVGLGACLGMFGFFFLFSGIMMISFGFNFFLGVGIVGCLLFTLGLSLIIACVVICRRERLQQQQQVIVGQQAGGVTTLVYGQPGAPAQIVQPVQPWAPPIVQPQGPEATIVYGPEGQVGYQPQIQPGFQPTPQGYPPTIPYPQHDPSALTPKADPSTDLTAPPPSYESAVNSDRPEVAHEQV